MKEILILGIGNEFRQDDALGPYLAGKLAVENIPGIAVRKVRGDGTDILAAWTGYSRVILLDALRSGRTPGTLLVHDLGRSPLPPYISTRTTHTLNLAESLELAKTLNQFPKTLYFVGIEGKSYSLGESFSTEVKESIPRALTNIRTLILELQKEPNDA